MHDDKSYMIRENAYRDLTDYNNIVFAHFRISQYENHEDFISKVINDKLTVQKLFSRYRAAKAIFNTKRARKELDELDGLIEVEDDEVSSSDRNEESDENEQKKYLVLKKIHS